MSNPDFKGENALRLLLAAIHERELALAEQVKQLRPWERWRFTMELIRFKREGLVSWKPSGWLKLSPAQLALATEIVRGLEEDACLEAVWGCGERPRIYHVRLTPKGRDLLAQFTNKDLINA